MGSLIQERLRVQSEIEWLSITHLRMVCKKDEHAAAEIVGTVSGQKGMNDFDGWIGKDIKLYDTGENEALFFTGLTEEIEGKSEGGLYTVYVRAAGYTVLLDREEKSRSWQDRNRSYLSIIENTLEERSVPGEKGEVWCGAGDEKVKSPVIRYKETDWEFIKRMASYLNRSVYPAAGMDRPGIRIGMRTGRTVDVKEALNISYIIDRRDGASHLLCRMENKERWNPGDRIIYRGHEMFAVEKEAEFSKGELRYKYVLAQPDYDVRKPYGNEKLKGAAIRGSVMDVKKELLKVHLDVDETQEKEEACWFPYLPDTGNMMYCMPETGDRVCLHIGSEWEKDAFIMNCMREGDGEREGAFLITPWNKRLLIDRERIGYLRGNGDNQGSFMLKDSQLVMREKKNIKIKAGGQLSLQAANVQVAAPEEITLMRRDLVQPSVVNLGHFLDIIAEGSGIQCTNEPGRIRTIEDEAEDQKYKLGEIENDILAAIPFDGMSDSTAQCFFNSIRK